MFSGHYLPSHILALTMQASVLTQRDRLVAESGWFGCCTLSASARRAVARWHSGAVVLYVRCRCGAGDARARASAVLRRARARRASRQDL